MNGLETAIRSALARSDRTSAEMRARIYQSARQALETGLRKQNINDPRILAEQRHRLESLIHTIEQQERAELAAHVQPEQPGRREPSFGQPVPPPSAPPPQPPSRAAPAPARPTPAEADIVEPVDSPSAPKPTTSSDPSADLGNMRAERDEWLDSPPRVSRIASAETSPAPDIRPDKVIRQRKPRRRLLSRLFILVTLLAAAGTAAWWVYSSGLLISATERDTSVPNPPPTVEAEDFTGDTTAPRLDAQQGFSSDWISVFEPNQAASLNAHEDAIVEPVTASDGNAVRITSRSPDSDGEVEIAVPVAIMRDMVGKTSTIALTLQAAGDKPVQISVDCDFDLLGSCPRHRFTVNPEKTDVLLRVAFDQSLAPSSPGMLTLNGDVGGTGQPINLYSVRILPGQ